MPKVLSAGAGAKGKKKVNLNTPDKLKFFIKIRNGQKPNPRKRPIMQSSGPNPAGTNYSEMSSLKKPI